MSNHSTIPSIPGRLLEVCTGFGEAVALERAGRSGPFDCMTFKQLDLCSKHIGCSLTNLGFQSGQTVGLRLDPGPKWVACLLGSWLAGLRVLPLTPGHDFGRQPRTLECLRETRVLDEAFWRECFDSSTFQNTGIPRFDPKDPALLMPTSGSMSAPHLVELSHGNIGTNLDCLLAYRRSEPSDVLASLVPPSHMFGLMLGILAPLCCGTKVVFLNTAMPNRVLERLANHQVTHLVTVPSWVDALLSHAKGIGGDASDPIPGSLKTIILGGCAPSPACALFLRTHPRLEAEIGYGLTEASPIISLGNIKTIPIGSCGRPLRSLEVHVREDGELWVKGPSVAESYWNHSDAGKDTLQGGWLHTGDLGNVDANGFLFVKGRKKEVMVDSNGVTMHPDEFEPYYQCPQIKESCVVGIPDSQGNDKVTWIAVPRDPDCTRNELIKLLARMRLSAPDNLQVNHVLLRKSPLPRTDSGKVLRRVLSMEYRPSGPVAAFSENESER